jgi:hypothetical protein
MSLLLSNRLQCLWPAQQAHQQLILQHPQHQSCGWSAWHFVLQVMTRLYQAPSRLAHQ